MIAFVTRMPARMSEAISEEALRAALQDRCRGGSWRGLARGLAWRVVSAGERNPHSIETLAEAAEAMFASFIDEALWLVERAAIQGWFEFMEACPGDEDGALAAARLDAREESVRLVGSGCERIVERLLAHTRRAA
jgi:hypothetical protein